MNEKNQYVEPELVKYEDKLDEVIMQIYVEKNVGACTDCDVATT